MSRVIQKVEKEIYICDFCSKKSESGDGWLTIDTTEVNGLRLFEKKQTATRYESFNIPNKKELTFCSKDCIFKRLKDSISLFINEIQPFKNRKKTRL